MRSQPTTGLLCLENIAKHRVQIALAGNIPCVSRSASGCKSPVRDVKVWKIRGAVGKPRGHIRKPGRQKILRCRIDPLRIATLQRFLSYFSISAFPQMMPGDVFFRALAIWQRLV
jgi:hypothetical protein